MAKTRHDRRRERYNRERPDVKKSDIKKPNAKTLEVKKNETFYNLLVETHRELKARNWTKALRSAVKIIGLEGRADYQAGYKLAYSACKKLDDIKGMERYLKMALKAGVEVIYIAEELLDYFYTVQSYSELEEFYNKTKLDPKLSFKGHITMINYYGDIGNFDSAKEVYIRAMQQQQTTDNFNARSDINASYISSVLEKKSEQELQNFIQHLKLTGQLTEKVLVIYLGTLYARQNWTLLIEEYKKNRFQRASETTLLYLNALRKSRRYNQALREAEEFTKTLHNGDPAKNWALSIQGFCLTNLGRAAEAQVLFKKLIPNLDQIDTRYLWTICGYIFTRPKLNPAEKQQFKQALTQQTIKARNTSLRKDITDALSILETL